MKIKYENTLCCYCRHWAFVCVGLSWAKRTFKIRKAHFALGLAFSKMKLWQCHSHGNFCIGKLSPATVRKPGNKTKDSLGHFVCGDKKGLPKLPNSSWNGQCSSDDPRNHAQKTIFGIMNHGFQQLQRPCLKAFLKFLSSAKHVGTDHANSSHT